MFSNFFVSSLFKGAMVKDLRETGAEPEVFFKKRVLTNSAKFTGKHQCASLLFKKILRLHGEIQVRKKPHAGILYVVVVFIKS